MQNPYGRGNQVHSESERKAFLCKTVFSRDKKDSKKHSDVCIFNRIMLSFILAQV